MPPLVLICIVDVIRRLRFNPCCAGCSSGRLQALSGGIWQLYVSILVVLDVVLEGDTCSMIGEPFIIVSILVVLDVVLEVFE